MCLTTTCFGSSPTCILFTAFFGSAPIDDTYKREGKILLATQKMRLGKAMFEWAVVPFFLLVFTFFPFFFSSTFLDLLVFGPFIT
uniref:Uncharacterized protein n=1 Tax=Arundo donax TaxID=35708 RepID=A0A0A9HIQ2_ARUDO